LTDTRRDKPMSEKTFAELLDESTDDSQIMDARSANG
jgi:hypothetical protein